MEGFDGITQDVSSAPENTDLIIMEEISALADQDQTSRPFRIPPIVEHSNNSPSISLNSFSVGRNGRRYFPRNPSKFGNCDSNSYCLSCMSVIFVALGAFITVTTLGGTKFSLGHMWSVGPIFFCVGIMMAMKCYVYLRSKREIEMLFIAEIVCQQMMRLEEDGRRRLVERSQHYFNSHGITRDIFTLVTDQVLSNPTRIDNRTDQNRNYPNPIVALANNNVSPVNYCEISVQETPPLSLNRTSLTASPNSVRNLPPSYETITKPDIEAPPPTYNEAVALIAQHKLTNEIQLNPN